MAKLIQALFDLKLVSQESLKQMTTMRDGEGMGMTSFAFVGKTLYGETGGSDSTFRCFSSPPFGGYASFSP
jgi:hypothetical protein